MLSLRYKNSIKFILSGGQGIVPSKRVHRQKKWTKERKEKNYKMATFLTILISIISLLVAMWVPLTTGPNGIGAKRVLAWFVIVTGTLIIPCGVITWVVIQVSARILAPTTSDVSSFVSQIAWSAGVISALYPLIWGVKFQHYFEKWINKVTTSPEVQAKKKP